MTHNLSKEEIAYFYELLYKYEHESHAGYQDKEVEAKMGSDVLLDDNHQLGNNISTPIENTLQFTPYRNIKCWAILYHVRNALAHGNIQSVDNDKYFLIRDFSDKSKRQVCNMLAKIEKKKLYELINAIEDTRKNPRKNNKSKKVKK